MPELDKGLSEVVNKHIKAVGPSGIREFDQKISSIPGIVKLTLGEPDFNVPEHVKQAAIKSIEDNKSHYSAQKGIIELRRAISRYLSNRTGIDYDPETEIVVTVGATEAIFSALTSMLNPGDKVIVPTPAFALYFPIIQVAGAELITIDTSDDGFVLTPEKLQKALDENGDRVKAIVLNYPSNPTGVEYSQEQLQALADIISKHHMFVLADEIYNELTYGVKHYSIAKLLPSQTIVVNGLSKSHAMTGYRIGYFAAPKDFVTNAAKMHGFAVTCPSNPAQYAALEALTNGLEDAVPMREQYNKRRDYIAKRLEEMGMEIALPQGAFYIFAKIPDTINETPVEFATDLAEKAKVGVVPGSAFGPGGERYIRMSYAASDEDIKLAMDRMSAYLLDRVK
ncbi:aminotransferase class I/II-fold pyridoxal phosphate-dependent enzyme [Lentilactobacillus hilgardii]|uniref:aminotransferase class I/II-fold pyridoxal phosphate-dependent enzyme n=1 Tax=Lentilactobacillus hilgardii TaxID=1588 RepID=UPI0021C29372|nr:aminotransferase class I/II-fold pyridoxal phosphate-dependent enzyme [Lentilactobacillus hilgardii]MCP9332540.1 aminotransferase class I/II-fold pyridoxal phosphate-dependent enzyme [Lentilactobacillus hilgardii]MCP9349147.1 aminotransferase class I/II-fold pyridoxal phosphate-dependent enzyme [Lentilactobacillus hilgardii]MCP9352015.1 aminotransferase class I/II-fold pyridoxal phosphate-dependent enzyme [Lentilactobacillus hilgardii]